MTDTSRTGWAAKFSTRAVCRAALACLIGGVLLTSAPARAADDESVPLDTKILRSILEGLGLQREANTIDYQERAPLVIPPIARSAAAGNRRGGQESELAGRPGRQAGA